MDTILGLGQLLNSVIKWLVARKRPNITCDIKYLQQTLWGPDWLHDDNGNELTSGIEFRISANLSLINQGSIDTSIKDIYIILTYNKNKHTELKSILRPNIVIEPRRIWGPKSIDFHGSIWGIDTDKLPEKMKFQLIVEPVAHRKIKKLINPRFQN